MGALGADKAVAAIMKWSEREDWREQRTTVFADHFGAVLEDFEMTVEEVIDTLGSGAFMQLVGCALEDFMTCNFEPDEQCGATDRGGMCETRPEVCTTIYEPVCGCDHRTYSSDCMAHGAGVSVKREGLCSPDECKLAGGTAKYSTGADIPKCAAGEDQWNISGGIEPVVCCLPRSKPQPGGGKTCGGIAGLGCDDGQFCNGADQCVNGLCDAHAGNPCPGPDGDLRCNESCSEAARACTAADPDASSCDDGLLCNGADSCSGGLCSVHQNSACTGADGDANCAESCSDQGPGCESADPFGSHAPGV